MEQNSGETWAKVELNELERRETIIREKARAEGYTEGLKTAQRDHFNGGVLFGILIAFGISALVILLLKTGGWL